MQEKDEYIHHLEAENAKLRAQLVNLEQKLAQLLADKVVKTSQNSSLPPSQDKPASKARKSLRRPSERLSGGQEGHPGQTLECRSQPDEVVNLQTGRCVSCGQDLGEVAAVFHSRRQVFDLSLPAVKCIEYRAYARICPVCQTKNVGAYPSLASAPVQYSPQIGSLVSYLAHYQYLPYARLQSLLRDVFGLSLSQGTLANMLERMYTRSACWRAEIKKALQSAQVVGSDETSVPVNGQRQWIWVWQNEEQTFLQASKQRGYATVAQVWPEGLPGAILVSDRWAAQLKTPSTDKQLCLAHLQREVQFLVESENTPFAHQFKHWLHQVWQAKRQTQQEGQAYCPQARQLQTQLQVLLQHKLDPDQSPHSRRFLDSMTKYKDWLLTTLYHLEVPPDNNGSERAIRNVKVKVKVSGMFKSGVDAFCAIRSLIDTAIKKGQNVLHSLHQIYQQA
ncbi:MAG: IS66 family transposase [Microscillaceae bacterium]|nr:IS66 family transposase [Microscillaceae bacterium]